jgi:hypothetical protein
MVTSLCSLLYAFKYASNTSTYSGGIPFILTSTSKLGISCSDVGVGNLMLYWERVIQIPISPYGVGSFPNYVVCDEEGAIGTAWTK